MTEKEIVMFPVPKDLVEQFIRVYSGIKECGGCDNPLQNTFTCVVCEKEWGICQQCDKDIGGLALIEICDHCEGWICKECMQKCDNRYPGIKKGIREQMFCEYDIEMARKFEREQDAEIDRCHERRAAGELNVQFPRIEHYFDTRSHQPKFGSLLCAKCIANVPRCERCDHTLYLCGGVAGDNCERKPGKWEELLRLHREFSCDGYLESKMYNEEQKECSPTKE